MAEIWGHKWGSQYGANANYDGEWAEMILSLSMGEIMKGLDVERRSAEKWPSPVPVFRRNAEGGQFNFNKIYETCVYWSNNDVLERKGLSKTRECLFIIRLIGADLREARSDKAERLVRFGIEELEKHLEAGHELPDWPKAEIEHKELPKTGFSLAEFMKLGGV